GVSQGRKGVRIMRPIESLARSGRVVLVTLPSGWFARIAVRVRRRTGRAASALAVVLLAFLVLGVGGLPAGSPAVTVIDLGPLGGTLSTATAVNDHGQIVGYSDTAGDAERHAFSWTEEGGIVDLGTLGGTSSSAVAVNEHGQVVGTSDTTETGEV